MTFVVMGKGGDIMAENYKHLYEVTKKMLTKYQDEVVPELRRLLDERVEVVHCGECEYSEQHDLLPYKYLCHIHKIERRAMSFCSEGKRRGENQGKGIREITECLKQINEIFERERRESDETSKTG